MSGEAENVIPSEKIDLIVPTAGKLFFEQKAELMFCKPHLLPLKSLTLEKLEKMQNAAEQQIKESRAKTPKTSAATTEN